MFEHDARRCDRNEIVLESKTALESQRSRQCRKTGPLSKNVSGSMVIGEQDIKVVHGARPVESWLRFKGEVGEQCPKCGLQGEPSTVPHVDSMYFLGPFRLHFGTCLLHWHHWARCHSSYAGRFLLSMPSNHAYTCGGWERAHKFTMDADASYLTPRAEGFSRTGEALVCFHRANQAGVWLGNAGPGW
jgi:hypothetical protein